MANPQKKRGAGWFVEVPPELKAEFKALYPTRAAMKKWTIFAIKIAIMRHPSKAQLTLPIGTKANED